MNFKELKCEIEKFKKVYRTFINSAKADSVFCFNTESKQYDVLRFGLFLDSSYSNPIYMDCGIFKIYLMKVLNKNIGMLFNEAIKLMDDDLEKKRVEEMEEIQKHLEQLKSM